MHNLHKWVLLAHSVLILVWIFTTWRLANQLSVVRRQILELSMLSDESGLAQNSIQNGSSPGSSVRLKSGSEAEK